MSNKIIQEIDARCRIMAMRGHHKAAIKMLRNHLKRGKIIDDGTLIIKLAFMLYHDALKDFWSKTASEKRKKEVKEEMGEAIDILEKTIPEMKKIGDGKKVLNSQIFLAQIYASMGDGRAIKIARGNFKLCKDATTANRLADVYSRLNRKSDSLRWYKKYNILAEKEKWPSYERKTVMAIAYFSLGELELGNKIAKEIINRFPKSLKGQSMRNILQVYLHTKAGSN